MFELQYLCLNQGYSSYIVSVKLLKITHNKRLEFYSNLETVFFLICKANNSHKDQKLNNPTIPYEDYDNTTSFSFNSERQS